MYINCNKKAQKPKADKERMDDAMKKGKITIYDNRDLLEAYEDSARERLAENGNTEPTEEEVWEEVFIRNEIHWEDVKNELSEFFGEGTWIIFGTAETWTSKRRAGTVFTDFMDIYKKVSKDCDVYIYEEKGHFLLMCSGHDGTSLYEIKRITDKGIQYLVNWEDNWNDNRSEYYVHKKIFELYSTIPNYTKKKEKAYDKCS